METKTWSFETETWTKTKTTSFWDPRCYESEMDTETLTLSSSKIYDILGVTCKKSGHTGDDFKVNVFPTFLIEKTRSKTQTLQRTGSGCSGHKIKIFRARDRDEIESSRKIFNFNFILLPFFYCWFNFLFIFENFAICSLISILNGA